MNLARTMTVIAWASPATLIGMFLGLVGLSTGGRVRRVGRVIEFWGGLVAWFLERCTLLESGASAMTLGHVVLGRTTDALDDCREHEWVHVRQYERWGPAFIPAYFLCSFWLWCTGRDFYRDNPFEREAFDHSDPSGDNPE